jgi:ATP-dependent DNA helicase RecG
MVPSELTTSVLELPGIGRSRAELFARLGVETLGDLLFFLPLRYEDRSRVVTLVEAARRGEGLVAGQVLRHEHFPFGGKRVLKITIADESSTAALVCFGRDFLGRSFPPGSTLQVYGKFSLRYGEIQTSVFDARKVTSAQPEGLVPVYPLTDGLTQKAVRTATSSALHSLAAELEDPIPPSVRKEEKLMALPEALREVHNPASPDTAEAARRRLCFEELFLYQLILARRTMLRRRDTVKSRPKGTGKLLESVRSSLPFSLTADQDAVLGEILDDLDRPWPMSRLLHGDVGSGKTLVAILAALHAIERGEQVVLMVPTELLARQHAWNAAALVSGHAVSVALVLGGIRSPVKQAMTDALAAGEINLVIGTHALFSEGLVYANLGLVIIDEQHRFGVSQREAILSRGTAPDLLLMSATPIPRSLALTAFGESDISTIRTMPPGRKPVETHLARMGNEQRVYNFVQRELEAGRQAYFVYPAIDEGGTRELRSATDMADTLARHFTDHSVGLVHSRMDTEERARTMRRFQDGEIDVLVATSVVEVGVDVPNATCMVIEHAELFGLAALHQLRGRVGRGDVQAYCVLVYQEPLTDDGKERLRVLYQSTDGFHIAEEDLRIRGPGDLLGTRQAGFLPLRIADIRRDMDLMITARRHIADILRDDPDLAQPEHRATREALATLYEEKET